MLRVHEPKGEVQCQNKLISFEKTFKILQNDTKIIKMYQAVLEIFNFKGRDLDNFMRKNDKRQKYFFRDFAQTEEQQFM